MPTAGRSIYFCFIDYAKVFDCVDHKKLWKILKKTGIPEHLTCLLRNLYEDQDINIVIFLILKFHLLQSEMRYIREKIHSL